MRTFFLILALIYTTFGFTSPALQAAPFVEITRPADAPNNLYKTLDMVIGTATPAAGHTLSAVQIMLRRVVPNTSPRAYEFWNGSDWHPAPATRVDILPATATGSGGSFATWLFSLSSVADLRDGNYEVRAIATDTSGQALTGYKEFVLDSTGPKVVITRPAHGERYSLLPKAYISVSDSNGIRQVEGADQVFGILRRRVGGRYQYWAGGDSWTQTFNSGYRLAQPPGTSSYVFDFPTLPAGVYWVGAKAADRLNNAGLSVNPVNSGFWTEFRITGLRISGQISGGGVGVNVLLAPSEQILLAAAIGTVNLPQVQTNAEGRFAFGGLVPGTYLVAPRRDTTYYANGAGRIYSSVTLTTSGRSDVNFRLAGTDTKIPTLSITSPTNFGTYATTASGQASDSGSALLGVGVSVGRIENSSITGYYNFQTGQFDPVSAAQITAAHIKGAEPVLPASPFVWTVSGLPTLPSGSYVVRVEAADIAFNNVTTQSLVTMP